ncbi:hypothetical protein [Pandoraea capi]|uniref:hypothetical protein n=1 Tax=Pandoraea capi TaxID=2508286 RepID=UPI00124093CF|nr:hypothetical protein [Pandoraea capi]
MGEALGQIVATGFGTAVGAVVGGRSSALTGFNTDRLNRQLHPDDASICKKIASISGGKYTEQQISDALRAANNSQRGESVTTGMVVDGASNPEGIYD